MTAPPEVPAPSGTVTFLFSDIEGSTRRWDRDRAAMQDAVRLHDGILRDAIATHKGYIFKTVGDAFCAAFGLPEAAARAAIGTQRALAAADFSAVEGLRARIAIHTGTADERDGDYFGPALNRVARLLPLGHGGQILLTAIAADLIRENLPPGASLQGLGPHTLRDLKGEEYVHQLVAEGLQREFPALRAHKASGHPWLVPEAMRTRYFTGREELLGLVHRQLAERERVALCGLGGAGKTQAAMEFAARHRSDYPAGVFWVNAETTSGLTGSFVEIANSLSLEVAASGDQAQAVRAVMEWLEGADGWLLIFDNVEDRHEIRPFVPKPGKGHILITSRESVFQELGIPRALEVRDLDNDEAVGFLLARTGREECDPQERAAASELSAELGNLPLALEQAAAYIAETAAAFSSYLSAFRKRRLSLLEKASGLVSRDTVSVTWAANFAAVEHASPESADVLRLSALLAPDAIPFELFESAVDCDELATVELLRPLARYSLVRTDAAARAYGVHRLVQEIVRAALGESQCRMYLERAVTVLSAAFPDAHYRSWVRCDKLVEHVVSVAHWVIAFDAQPDGVTELFNKTGRYLMQRGRYSEAEAVSQKALLLGRRLGRDRLDVAASLNNLAIVYQRWGRLAESEPLYEQALAIRESVLGPNHTEVAHTLLNYANLYYLQGRYEQAAWRYERAAAIWQGFHGIDFDEFFATAINNIARIHEKRGRYDEARQLDQRALAIRERVLGTDHPHVALSLSMLANGEARRGNFAEAQALHERALGIREQALGPHHDEVAESLNDFAAVLVKQGRYADARPLFERALAIGERTLGPRHSVVADSLHGLAHVDMKEGRRADAETLFKRALKIRELALGPDHTDVAESLLGMASLYADAGRRDEAAAHLERALTIRQGTLGPDHPEMAKMRNALLELRDRQHVR